MKPALVRSPYGPARAPGRIAVAVLFVLLASGCGGGGGASSTPTPTPTPPAKAAEVQLSAASTLPAGCGAATSGSVGEAYTLDSAVQPQVAANPASGTTLYGIWEQDRWNAIGARAINFSRSVDGGASWGTISALPFSACGGGAGAVYDRASDPSVAVGAGGIVYASALAFSAANYMASGGVSTVLVSRSTDGGTTWSVPHAPFVDTGSVAGPSWYFNDRDALAADPASSNVYLVWDRLTSNSGAASIPTWMIHSGDGGITWDPARVIYDPGAMPFSQTFNNQPLVLPDGSVVILFTLFYNFTTQLAAIRSTDHGATWPASGAATIVANMLPVGTQNPFSSGPPIRDSSLMAQTAVDPVNGTLAAVWQDGSFSGGVRDGIALTLSADKGAHWTTPVQVNTAKSVAAFDPAVHFGSGGRIAVTYYDLRDYVAGSTVLSTSLWLIESTDGGATWTETRLVGPFDLNKAPPADTLAGQTGNALFLGDQQGLTWNGTDWVALNSATISSGARIFAARLP